MIIVKGEARAGAGEIERLRAPLMEWIAAVRRRDGCLGFNYAIDLGDPGLVHVIQSWRDEAALDAHLTDLGPLLHIIAGADIPSLKVDAYQARFARNVMGG